jgi:hypothetical protein
MKNAALIVLTIAVAILGSLLYTQNGLVRAQQQAIDDLGAKLRANEKTTDLELQAKCATQARNEYESNGWSKRPFATFLNHYSETLNKCFIEIQDIDASIGTTKVIDDAFEGKTYANYFWRGEKGKKYWEVPPAICNVTISGKDAECESSDEFDKLAEAYMDH